MSDADAILTWLDGYLDKYFEAIPMSPELIAELPQTKAMRALREEVEWHDGRISLESKQRLRSIRERLGATE